MTLASEIPAIDSSTTPVGGRRDVIVATDAELLMQFSRHGDHRAFAQIVERHGGLVWIVCREVLRHRQDVEDAFQATFFILAERARSIRNRDSAAAWLYKVAQRTSLAARRKRSRRREEELLAEPLQGEAEVPLHDRQMVFVLMEELRRLPERYQVPLVLRYLEGQSRRAIADQTDSTIAQIQGRLVRGRRLLRSRMVRHGVSLSLAAGAITSANAEANIIVTPTLATATAKNCLTLKTKGAIGGATASALALAQQGAKAMWLASVMKTTAAVGTALVVAGLAWAVETGGGGNGAGKNESGTTVVVAVKPKDQPADGNASADLVINGSLTVNGGTLSENSGSIGHGTIKKEGTGTLTLSADNTYTGATLAFGPNGTAGKVAEERKAELKRVYDNRLKELHAMAQQKIKASAELEMRQLKKANLQRALERLQTMLMELELPPVAKETDDEQHSRMGRRDTIAKRSSQLQDELVQVTLEAANMSVDAELMQMDMTRVQRRLEELDRVQAELEIQPAIPAATQNTSAAMQRPAPEYLRSLVQRVYFDVTGVPPTAEQMDVVVNAPNFAEAYGAMVERLLQSPRKDKSEANPGLAPGNVIRIQVSNALPAEPIDDVYTVESMGTIALGPTYGRVKVKGMTVLEAEKAIAIELSKMINDPLVQVTQAGVDQGPAGTRAMTGRFEAAVPPPTMFTAPLPPNWAPSGPMPANAMFTTNLPAGAAPTVSPAQIKQMELERDAAQLKAAALARRAKDLDTVVASGGSKAATPVDVLLSQAEAKAAEAQAVGLSNALEQLKAAQKPASTDVDYRLQSAEVQVEIADLKAENEKLKKELKALKEEKAKGSQIPR